MTQDERWMARYNEVKSFIEEHHRNPSKYYDEEKLMVHFLKRGRKLMNAGALQEPRLGLLNESGGQELLYTIYSLTFAQTNRESVLREA